MGTNIFEHFSGDNPPLALLSGRGSLTCENCAADLGFPEAIWWILGIENRRKIGIWSNVGPISQFSHQISLLGRVNSIFWSRIFASKNTKGVRKSIFSTDEIPIKFLGGERVAEWINP